MKTKLIHTALLALFTMSGLFAQNVTTVRANNNDISDNLDLQAVASIFGESADLEDFERRLNDPKIQISNLDLNGDNRVDYLRVIEATENNTHLIILQAVLNVDTYQDVATIEVERDNNNNVNVQVVGDVYMYGANYIYEPVYVVRPPLFNVFWASSYRPYYSPWYWNYYPNYYSHWSPYPVNTYYNNVHVHIDRRNTYHYVNTRRSTRAVALYSGRRSNAYERQNPGRSFASRNENVSNRHELVQSRGTTRGTATATRANTTSGRNTAATSTRSTTATRNATPARSSAVRSSNNTVRNTGAGSAIRNTSTRTATPAAVRATSNTARSNNAVRTATPARATSAPRQSAPAVRSTPAPQRQSAPAVRSTPAPQRQSAPAVRSAPAPQRQSAPAVRSAPAPQRQSAPAVRSTPAPQRQSAPASNSGRRG